MGAERIRSLPVTEDGELKGIVTRTDLLSNENSRFLSAITRKNLSSAYSSVGQIMITDVITIKPDTSILDAAQLLLEIKSTVCPLWMMKRNSLEF